MNLTQQEQLVGIAISFGRTLPQLLSGNKSVTRRAWADSYGKAFVNRFKEGKILYPAFDKDRRYGGKQIGLIRLTCPPYKERLGDMPAADLILEGFPELNRWEFMDRFFGGDWELKVWVVRFEFIGGNHE